MSIFENKKLFLIDCTGKSIAIFFKSEFPKLNSNYIKSLISFSKKRKYADVRICMHKNRKSKIQNMINLIHKKKKRLFHKHRNKDEVYHIIKGQMLIEFIEDNKIKKILINNNNQIFRIKKNIFHRIRPLTSFAIFHEIREGPFRGNDSVFIKN